jgi:hypothetical protein
LRLLFPVFSFPEIFQKTGQVRFEKSGTKKWYKKGKIDLLQADGPFFSTHLHLLR